MLKSNEISSRFSCASFTVRTGRKPRYHGRSRSFYQALADAFERDQVEGLIDEETIGQLSGVLYELDSQGSMRIEAKDKARARGVPSPDRADALMLAIAAADPCKYPPPDIFWLGGGDDEVDDDWWATFMPDRNPFRGRRRR